MTHLPLDRPAAASVSTTLGALCAALKSLLPQPGIVDGDVAHRQNALRAEARAKVDRLLG